MEKIELTEEFLLDKMRKYVSWFNENGYDKNVPTESLRMVNEYYIGFRGLDLYSTSKGTIKGSVYNLRPCFLMHDMGFECNDFRFEVNPNTFEYDIYIDSVKNPGITYGDKIMIDGIIANTLYQCFYSKYRNNYPILCEDSLMSLMVLE